MIENDKEFEHIRTAIEAATETLAGAIEKHGECQWDYLIVAVPTGRRTTRIAMMSSVLPRGLPSFIEYILNGLRVSAARNSMLTDMPGEGQPS
jgi:hypothetical protein